MQKRQRLSSGVDTLDHLPLVSKGNVPARMPVFPKAIDLSKMVAKTARGLRCRRAEVLAWHSHEPSPSMRVPSRLRSLIQKT